MTGFCCYFSLSIDSCRMVLASVSTVCWHGAGCVFLWRLKRPCRVSVAKLALWASLSGTLRHGKDVVEVEVLLYVQRNRSLLGTGAQDIHLDFLTVPELWGKDVVNFEVKWTGVGGKKKFWNILVWFTLHWAGIEVSWSGSDQCLVTTGFCQCPPSFHSAFVGEPYGKNCDNPWNWFSTLFMDILINKPKKGGKLTVSKGGKLTGCTSPGHWSEVDQVPQSFCMISFSAAPPPPPPSNRK